MQTIVHTMSHAAENQHHNFIFLQKTMIRDSSVIFLLEFSQKCNQKDVCVWTTKQAKSIFNLLGFISAQETVNSEIWSEICLESTLPQEASTPKIERPKKNKKYRI